MTDADKTNSRYSLSRRTFVVMKEALFCAGDAMLHGKIVAALLRHYHRETSCDLVCARELKSEKRLSISMGNL